MSLVDEKTDSRKSFSRRDLLTGISGVWLGGHIEGLGMLPFLSTPKGQPEIPSVNSSPQSPLSPEDDLFLEELERDAVDYFWEETNPETGLVKDRCNVRAADTSIVASIAATGFGLTALCIGEKRRFIYYYEARRRVLNTLKFL